MLTRRRDDGDFHRVPAVTLWEIVWQQVAKEMPRHDPRPKSWAGFIGATFAALVIIAIWFPIRLVHEILKAIDFSEKPDHTKEAQELFRDAYSLSLDLPTKSEFASSVLEHIDLPRRLHDALFEAFRNLYAENIMLTVPPIPADLEQLDGIRWRDRMRREIARMRGDAPSKMRRACRMAVESSTANLPKLSGDGEITSPLATLVKPGQFVENLVRPLEADLFPIFVEKR